MASKIRLAGVDDAGQVAEIYGPFVTGAVTSFESEAPTADEFAGRIRKTLETFPWLVCEEAGVIRGYVYASRHRERAAYQWCVDVAVYVREGHRGVGLGRGLYKALFDILRLQGFFNAYAGITQPNEASVRLHESMGFRRVGVYEKVGFKLGDWRDVGWWQFAIQDHVPNPDPPTPLPCLLQTAEWSECARKILVEFG